MAEIPTWALYEEHFKKERDWMRQFLLTVLDTIETELIENTGDDYGWSALITRQDGVVLAVTFEIWDASDLERDIEAGTKGNFYISGAMIPSGEQVFDFAPHRFTELCWADYTNDAEWASKKAILMQVQQGCLEAVQDWMAKGLPGIPMADKIYPPGTEPKPYR